uniref:Uncharacterized protein n=1 Tax=Arundo donax TaxID=35708 RepID=A0A0A9C860_ARUDO
MGGELDAGEAMARSRMASASSAAARPEPSGRGVAAGAR